MLQAMNISKKPIYLPFNGFSPCRTIKSTTKEKRSKEKPQTEPQSNHRLFSRNLHNLQASHQIISHIIRFTSQSSDISTESTKSSERTIRLTERIVQSNESSDY